VVLPLVLLAPDPARRVQLHRVDELDVGDPSQVAMRRSTGVPPSSWLKTTE